MSNNEVQTHSHSICQSSEQDPRRLLFKVEDAQELNDPIRYQQLGLSNLYGLVDELNNTETDMIGMKPKDAIKMD